jgi:hypothetical protein
VSGIFFVYSEIMSSDGSPPSIDFLHDFFGTRPQREDKSHSQINIGAFASMHRFLAKIVVTNIWPQARRSELTLKKATLLYAIVMRTPFCLCKHILHTMLEVRNEKNTSLSSEKYFSLKLASKHAYIINW